MCFQKINNEVKIATEDILCLKVLQLNNSGAYYDLVIDGKTEKWKKGTYYYEDTPFEGSKDRYVINGHAFHSCKSIHGANLIKGAILCWDGVKSKIVQMYIPKGAEYYENDTEYCSSAIVYP